MVRVGEDLQALLRERLLLGAAAAHQPIRLAIDAGQADERLVRAGPVLCGAGVEAVGGRPDAEVRVGDDEGDGGGAAGPSIARRG